MPVFIYKAKKSTAETVTGKINAHSQDEAIELINQLGFLPISVVAQNSDEVGVDRKHLKRARPKDLYLFARQMANLLNAGVSLVRALTILHEQAEGRNFKQVIAQVAWEVKNGRSFSDALSSFPEIFSSLFILMVKAGEESGNLREMLLSIAAYQKDQDAIQSKVKAAMAYPLFMGLVGLGTVYFILTFVIPKMSGLFENLGSALPLPTKILLKLSGALNSGWHMAVVAIVVILLVTLKWKSSPLNRIMSGRWVLKLPLWGDVVRKTEIARFCRSLRMLLSSGVSILRALDVSIPIINNHRLRMHLFRCKEELAAGGSLGEAIKTSADIPPIVGHLISIGEESGNLSDVLAEIVDSYELEVSEKIKVITTLLEPMMILVVGVVVGFIVFALLLPIFQIDILAQ